ncbi:MAG: 1-acyl-sn-glycerol-3-phosphate acyltransferase [Clostridiales bacterium]|nr:1-acyl-sn-glycerol-3-phosphate acyltransferase [Clostridiales bacterium]
MMFFNFIYSLLRIVFFPLYRLKIYGRENIPKTGGMLVCGNHTCLKDPIFIAFALGLKHPYTFMARSELFEIPIFGYILKNLGVFPVKRGSADVASIKTALRSLKEGKTLIIFPEGSRWSEDAKAGAGMLAVKGGAPVLPIFLQGSMRIFSTVTIFIGKPFKPDIPDSKDYKAISDGIMQKVRSLPKELSV